MTAELKWNQVRLFYTKEENARVWEWLGNNVVLCNWEISKYFIMRKLIDRIYIYHINIYEAFNEFLVDIVKLFINYKLDDGLQDFPSVVALHMGGVTKMHILRRLNQKESEAKARRQIV